MLRIDDELDAQPQTPQKHEIPTTRQTPNPTQGEDEDNFAALKAQAWSRMVPGQISQHLEQIRTQAQQLQEQQHAPKTKNTPPARILHYHCDHLGTPRELTDEDGKLVWSAQYLAWGKVKRLQGKTSLPQNSAPETPPGQFWHTRTQPGRASHLPEWVADTTGNVQRWRKLQEQEQQPIEAVNDPHLWGAPTDQSIRFQGQWHDPETGLHYNRFRYYDPDIGRFIHQDPIRFDGSVNWYQYAPTPTNHIDPFGLNWAAQTRRPNGQFGSKPPSATPKCGVSLHRPYIRADVRRAVEAKAPKTADGKFIDRSNPLNPIVINGPYHLGHKPTHEFWREKAKAEAKCMTQEEFNDYMNNPDFYRIEDPKSNMSHKNEDKSPL